MPRIHFKINLILLLGFVHGSRAENSRYCYFLLSTTGIYHYLPPSITRVTQLLNHHLKGVSTAFHTVEHAVESVAHMGHHHDHGHRSMADFKIGDKVKIMKPDSHVHGETARVTNHVHEGAWDGRFQVNWSCGCCFDLMHLA